MKSFHFWLYGKGSIYWPVLDLATEAQKLEVSCGLSAIFDFGMKVMPQILEFFACASGIFSCWGCWLPSATYNQIYLPFHVYRSESDNSFSISLMLVSSFLISSSEDLGYEASNSLVSGFENSLLSFQLKFFVAELQLQ